MFEKNEHILSSGDEFSYRLRDRLALLRRILRFAKPEVGEIGRRHLGHFEFLGFSPAECGVVLFKCPVNRVVEPGGVPKLEGVAEVFGKAAEKSVEAGNITAKIGRKLEQDRP